MEKPIATFAFSVVYQSCFREKESKKIATGRLRVTKYTTGWKERSNEEKTPNKVERDGPTSEKKGEENLPNMERVLTNWKNKSIKG